MKSLAETLDELMGKDRNLLPSQQSRQLRFDDPAVCKSFLCGSCPHDLFTNTKVDMGPCSLKHEATAKEEWARLEEKWRHPFEDAYLQHLTRSIRDLESRNRRSLARLDRAAKPPEDPQLVARRDAEVAQLDARIQETTERMSMMEEEGNVDELPALMESIEQLKTRRESARMQNVSVRLSRFDNNMEVCDTCGALLLRGDAPERIEAHMEGKQHQGYATIRSELERVKEVVEQRRREAREHGGEYEGFVEDVRGDTRRASGGSGSDGGASRGGRGGYYDDDRRGRRDDRGGGGGYRRSHHHHDEGRYRDRHHYRGRDDHGSRRGRRSRSPDYRRRRSPDAYSRRRRSPEYERRRSRSPDRHHRRRPSPPPRSTENPSEPKRSRHGDSP